MGVDNKEQKKTASAGKTSSPKKSKKKKGRGIFRVIYISLLLIIVAACAAGFGVAYGMIKTAPELDVNIILANGETTFIYDDKGEEIDEYKSAEKRISVDIGQVPKQLQDAFISIEDQRFEEHKGIDIRRLGGALIQDVKIVLGMSDGSIQGASTITQQLVKYKYFLEDSINNRTDIKRKVQEIYLSLQLEKKLTKDQILEAYMNTIYLGGDAYGIEAASQFYFDKSVEDLSLKQCAFLASAAQNPYASYINALEAYESGEAFDSPRTREVLNKMLELGKISQEEYDTAFAEPLVLNFTPITTTAMNYEWFSRPVVKQVVQDLMDTYGYTETEAYDKIAYGGLRIYTTMDKELQDKCQEIVNSSFSDYPSLQAAAAIMDYNTGEVKVLIGGRGEQPALSYNRAISVGNDGQTFLRSCGSSIKPLTVYGAGIDSKKITAGTVFVDGPIPRDVLAPYTTDAEYNPTNLPNRYDGYITVREAIRQSKNTAAVNIVANIGLDTSISYADKFKLSISDADRTSISALSLGQINGTTPYEMARAFGTFGNQGSMTEGHIYTKVTDREGKVLLETKYESTQVLSPQAAYIVYDMMKESIAYTGASAIFRSDMEIRGKTGTTSDYRDLYFAGLTPYYSGAVWLGYDDNSQLPFTGSGNSAALWGKLMAAAHEGLEYKSVEKPSGLTYATISKDSGTLATELTRNDPRGDRSYTEMYINGTQPTSLDTVHVMLDVVEIDGKYYLPSGTTPKDRIVQRVFITRDSKRYVGDMADNAYLAPYEVDPTDYGKIDKDDDDDKDKDDKDKGDDDKDKDDKDNPDIPVITDPIDNPGDNPIDKPVMPEDPVKPE